MVVSSPKSQNNPAKAKPSRKRRRRRGRQRGSSSAPEASFEESCARPKMPRFITSLEKKRYAVKFYDTLAQAKADMESLRQEAQKVDQLNIVVKAEGDMEDPELNQIGKLFCGQAWYIIHQRRVQEGWYGHQQMEQEESQ